MIQEFINIRSLICAIGAGGATLVGIGFIIERYHEYKRKHPTSWERWAMLALTILGICAVIAVGTFLAIGFASEI